MARLVVYGRSSFCPDMHRWRRWVSEHPLTYHELDIELDAEARARVIAWTGHESAPTLVIAAADGVDPIEEPAPLGDRSARAVDRGTMLTEPSPGQIGPFLRRHGIPFSGDDEEEGAAGGGASGGGVAARGTDAPGARGGAARRPAAAPAPDGVRPAR